NDPDILMTITADASGTFSFDAFQTDSGDLNMTFIATAAGNMSGWTAQAKFTDSKPNTVTLAPSTVTILPGSPAIYTVTINFNGSGTSCTSPLSITTALPAGATASFSPTSVTSTCGNVTSTLTIATTAATPLGSYPFTVLAGNGGGTCQSGTATGGGT